MKPYKRMAVPAWVYGNAKMLQEDLARRGTDALPLEVRQPMRCPRCKMPNPQRNAAGIGVTVRCACGFEIPNENTLLTGAGLGVVMGLGLSALLGQMEGEEPPPQAAKEPVRKTIIGVNHPCWNEAFGDTSFDVTRYPVGYAGARVDVHPPLSIRQRKVDDVVRALRRVGATVRVVRAKKTKRSS